MSQWLNGFKDALKFRAVFSGEREQWLARISNGDTAQFAADFDLLGVAAAFHVAEKWQEFVHVCAGGDGDEERVGQRSRPCQPAALHEQYAALAGCRAGDERAGDVGSHIATLVQVGIAKAQIGNLVGPGAVDELTTVSTVDPIKVYASISEQEYLKAAEKQIDKREKMPLELVLADGSVYPRKGEMAFADRQIDVRTGTIRVATIFPNPNNMLRPGQFARIRAEIEVKKGALVIPQRAVSELQGKYLVAVVGPESKVSIKPVKPGARFGQLWVIDQGLQAGEKVVAEGTQKVREGMVVSPKPFGAEAPAGPAAAPTPGGKSEVKPQSKPEKR